MKGIFAVREVDYASVFSINTCTLNKTRARTEGRRGRGRGRAMRAGRGSCARVADPALRRVVSSARLQFTHYHRIP